MQNEGVGGLRPLGGWQRDIQLLFDNHRVVGLRDADPIGHAQHVSIDGQARHAKRVPEDDVGGFAADAWKGGEFLHRPWDFARVPLDHFRRHADERP